MGTIKTFVVKFANDWSMNLASMLAYSLITTIFPILLLVLSVGAIVLQPFVSAHIQDLAAAIHSAFPEVLQQRIDIAALLRHLIQITKPIAIVSLLTLLWLGSNLFVTMENAFSIIFRVRGRDAIPQRLTAVVMVLILVVLLPASLGAASLVTADSAQVRALLPSRISGALTYLGPLTALVVLWLLFLVIYTVVPNIRVQFRHAWRGALAAAMLFDVFQVLFPLYFKVFLTGNTRYGAAAATILVVIIWLWFFALITIVGAQINAVAMGLKAAPYDLARAVETAYRQFEAQATPPPTEAPDIGVKHEVKPRRRRAGRRS